MSSEAKTQQSPTTPESGDEFYLVQLLKLVWARKAWVFAPTVALAAVMAASFFQVREYEASVGLMASVNRRAADFLGAGSLLEAGFGQRDSGAAQTVLTLIRSPAFFQFAAEQLISSKEYDQQIGFLIPKFRRMPDGRAVFEGDNRPAIARILRPENPNRPTAGEVLADYLKNNTTVEMPGLNKKSDEIIISLRTPGKYISVDLVNAVAEYAVQRTTEVDGREIESAKGFLEGQLAGVIEKLSETEKQVVELQIEMLKGMTAEGLSETTLGALSKQLFDWRLEYSQNSRQVAEFSKLLRLGETSRVPASVQAIDDAEAVNALKAQLVGLRSERVAMLRQGYSSRSYRFKLLESQVASLETQITSGIADAGKKPSSYLLQLAKQVEQLTKRNQVLLSLIRSSQLAMKDQVQSHSQKPALDLQLKTLDRKAELEYQTIGRLTQKLMDLEVERLMSSDKLKILFEATLFSARYVSSPFRLVFVGGLVGAMLGLFAVALRDLIRPVVVGQSQLKRFGVPVLESVTYHRVTQSLDRAMGLHLDELLPFHHVLARFSDAKVLSVAGVSIEKNLPDLAAYLAMSGAKMGKKTLLLDLSRKCRRTQLIFGLSGEKRDLAEGLIQGDSPFASVWSQVRPGLDIALGGQDSRRLPFERRAELGQLFSDLRGHYELIIVHLGGVLNHAESQHFLALSDSQILVTRSCLTEQRDVARCLEQIGDSERARTSLLATRLFNAVERVQFMLTTHRSGRSA